MNIGKKLRTKGRESTSERASVETSSNNAAREKEDLSPMPPQYDLDKLYSKLLDELAVPQKGREAMLMEPNEKKWKLICQHRSYLRQVAGSSVAQTSAASFVTKLREASTSTDMRYAIDCVRETRVALAGNPKSWLKDFFDAGGLVEIANGIEMVEMKKKMNDYDLILEAEYLHCMKAAMNNQFGLESVMQSPDAIFKLALGFDSEDITICTLVLELLAVAAVYSAQGHELVLQAMDQFREVKNEPARFYSLVEALQSTSTSDDRMSDEVIGFQVNVLTFLNTLVNAGLDIEERMDIRGDLIYLGILNVLEGLSVSNQKEHQSVPEVGISVKHDNCAALLTQIEVFQQVMAADNEEVVRGGLNLSDPKDLFESIQAAATASGSLRELISILQHLLVVPAAPEYGKDLWSVIEDTVHLVVANDTDDPALKYSKLEKLLDLKEEIERLNKTVNAQRAELRALNEVIASTEREPRITAPSSSNPAVEKYQKLLKMGMPEEQVKLKMSMEGLDPKLLSQQCSSSSAEENTGTVAVATTYKNDPKYEKFFKLMRMGMPKDQVALKMQAEGLNPTILDRGDESIGWTEIGQGQTNQKANSDQRYEKFFKLKKLGMPTEQIKMKIAAEGLDPSVLDQSEVDAPTQSDQRQINPAAAKFKKLLDMGMPREQVEMKMKMEGVEVSLLDGPSVNNAAPQTNNRLDDPVYGKFFKLLKMGMPKEQVAMKMKSEGLNPDVLDSTNASHTQSEMKASAPAPPDPEVAKYLKLIKMGMPKEQVKIKMKADGVDPSKLDGGAGEAATHISKASLPKPAPPKDLLPAKPSVQPKVPLKNLFWSKIPDAKVKESLWMKLKDDKVPIDFANLEARFRKKESSASHSKSSKPTMTLKKPPPVISVLDVKRQQNVGIAIARYHMAPGDIKQALIEMDRGRLDIDMLDSMIKLLPTAEEVQALQNFAGDKSKLSKADQFFLEISSVPRFKDRMQVFLFSLSFDSQLEELSKSYQLVREAVQQVMNISRFKQVLETILALGNYLNGSTSRGGAYGFKLEGLLKLGSVKSVDNKESLLHYLVSFLEEKRPECLRFDEEISRCHEAKNISMSQLETEVKSIASGLRLAAKQLEISSSEKKVKGDRFEKIIAPFIKRADPAVEKLQKLGDVIRKDYEKAVQLLGESPNGISYGELSGSMAFFGILSDFVGAFQHAQKENEQRKQSETKAVDPKEKKHDKEKSGASGHLVDNLFGALKSGNAQDIVERFRTRRTNVLDENRRNPNYRGHRRRSSTMRSKAGTLRSPTRSKKV